MWAQRRNNQAVGCSYSHRPVACERDGIMRTKQETVMASGPAERGTPKETPEASAQPPQSRDKPENDAIKKNPAQSWQDRANEINVQLERVTAHLSRVCGEREELKRQAFEDVNALADLKNAYDKLAAVNAELLAALKDITEFGRSYGITGENAVDGIRDYAKAAIAKVEGNISENSNTKCTQRQEENELRTSNRMLGKWR